MQRKKTREQIVDSNLKKTLTRLKIKVADKEDLWLEFFQMAFEAYCSTVENGDIQMGVDQAEQVANMMLDRYEARWGKVAL